MQPIPYSLDEASQGSIGVMVTSGEIAYCAEVGGIKKEVAGQFVGAKAPRPVVCPMPPGPSP